MRDPESTKLAGVLLVCAVIALALLVGGSVAEAVPELLEGVTLEE